MERSARIYLRKGKYIITPFSETTQRLGVMTEPIFIYEELPDLIKNSGSVLGYSKIGISIEEEERMALSNPKLLLIFYGNSILFRGIV